MDNREEKCGVQEPIQRAITILPVVIHLIVHVLQAGHRQCLKDCLCDIINPKEFLQNWIGYKHPKVGVQVGIEHQIHIVVHESLLLLLLLCRSILDLRLVE